MLNSEVVMIMVTCGFCVTITPMAWSVVVDALNRAVNKIAPQPVFTFVDNVFGSGTEPEATESVHETVNGVLGQEGICEKECIRPMRRDTGHPITGTVRPKDRAIEKMFYLLFSIDTRAPQPLRYWQCISSILNLYAPTLLGMTPFVALIIHMTHKAHRTEPENDRYTQCTIRVGGVASSYSPRFVATIVVHHPRGDVLTRHHGYAAVLHNIRCEPVALMRCTI